jgi:succinate dehydrogenase / fumarate reductase, membrane anchor subunit
MVMRATNFSRNGVSDWLLQRFSAVILAAYTLFMLGFLVTQPQLDYATWSQLFSHTGMRIFTLLALVATLVHGWIALWGVVTDYLTDRLMGSKALLLRLLVLSGYALVSFVALVWGVMILWRI